MSSRNIKISVKKPASVICFALFAMLFASQVLPRLTQDSLAGDEGLDITDGCKYWRGEVLSCPEHPPLAKSLQAFPVWLMGPGAEPNAIFPPQTNQDPSFSFDIIERAIALSRLVTLLLGLSIGFVLYWITRQEPLVIIFITLFFWASEPALLAFSGLVSADIPLTLFFLLSVLNFQRSLEKPGVIRFALTGLLAGMALTIKFTALVLVAVFLALEFFSWDNQKFSSAGFWVVFLKRWFWGILFAFLVIFIVYLPETINNTKHLSPFYFCCNGFQTASHENQYPNYFLGLLTRQSHLTYYPVAFLIKSPLSFLILLATGVGLAVVQKLKFPTWIWLPPLICFIVFIPLHNMGIRNLLPTYPFFILMAAQAGGWFWSAKGLNEGRVFRTLLIGLLCFQAFSVGSSFSRPISYFNELISENKKIFWLGDSNLDIGQDTKRLAQAAKKNGWDHVKLAYMGQTNPSLYGMKWDYWHKKDLSGPQAGWVYAIDAEFIQLGPAFLPGAGSVLKSWIMKYPPTGKIGDTWYYFEMPGTPMDDSSDIVGTAFNFKDDLSSKQ